MDCLYCNDLNEEFEDIEVCEIRIRNAGYFSYYIPINYCPNCGRKLDKCKEND